jgi:hypothetical protein
MVSAKPENLIKYSAACTAAAQEFQNWVSSVLAPALLDYQNSGKGHPCVPLDGEVAVAIANAYYTDRDVSAVARAFQQTQHGAALSAHGLVTASDSAVNTAYDQLQQENQARMQAGAALAQQLMALQPPTDKNRTGSSPEAAKPIMQELAKHANDPYFCAGFYNALDAQHFDTALALGGIPALVSAYSSGAVSQRTTALVAMRVGAPASRGGAEGPMVPWHHISSEQKAQLLDAFAANPSAAYFLTKSLTPSQVREMFYGDRPFSGQVVKVLKIGMQGEHAPQAARDLMHKVSIGLFGDGAPTLSNSEWKQLVGPVRDFYAQGVLNGIAPPTDFSRLGLEEWQRLTGANVGQDVALFLKALNGANPDNELIRSMIQGGYVNVGFMWTATLGPEGVAFTAAVGALQSAYSAVDPGATWLGKAFPPGNHPDAAKVNAMLAMGGFTSTLRTLGLQGKVFDASGKPLVFNGSAQHDQQLLDNMLADPDHHTVGTGKDSATVNELLDAFARTEQTEPLQALGNPDYKPSYQ